MTTLREALNKPGCERIKDYYSVGPIQKAAVEQFLDEYMALAIKETVNKFLGWKLPLDFYPDNGISFDKKYVEKWGMPTGTNLLTADQATEMFKHCLSVTTQPAPQAQPSKESEMTTLREAFSDEQIAMMIDEIQMLRAILKRDGPPAKLYCPYCGKPLGSEKDIHTCSPQVDP